MAQPGGFSKNPLKINPFWKKSSAELPFERSKWAELHEMAVFAKDRIEVRNLLKAKLALFVPAESILEVEITGGTEAQKKKRDVKTQRSKSVWKTAIKKPEKTASCLLGTRLMQKSAVISFYVSARRDSARFTKRGQASTCTVFQQNSS